MLLTYTEDGRRLACSEYRADHEPNGVYLPLVIWKHLKVCGTDTSVPVRFANVTFMNRFIDTKSAETALISNDTKFQST